MIHSCVKQFDIRELILFDIRVHKITEFDIGHLQSVHIDSLLSEEVKEVGASSPYFLV